MIRTAQKAPKRKVSHEEIRGILNDAAKKRGPKPSGNAKVLLTLRVDQDTIARFKASGDGWQTKMVDALAAAALKLDAPVP
jgi:uncharacterized protein (DUF4415 family)